MTRILNILGGSGDQLPATPPTAVNDAANITQNTAATINVLANDVVGSNPFDLASVRIDTAPLSGTAVPQASGAILYTPATGFSGTASFRYSVADTEGLRSNTALVSLLITALVTSPTDIERTPAGTLSFNWLIPSGTVIATLRATGGGNGSGTWAFVSGNPAFLALSAVTGASINLVTNRALTAADIVAASVVVRYSGDGLVTPLTETVAFAIVDPPAPSSIVIVTPTPIIKLTTLAANADIADVSLPAGEGTGAGVFTKSAGFSGASVQDNGRTAKVRTNRALTDNDAGDRSVTVQYAGEGLATPRTRVVSFTLNTPVVSGPTWRSGYCSNASPSGVMTAVQAIDAKIGRTCGAYLINSGGKDASQTWANFKTSLGGNANLVSSLLDQGTLPILNVPVAEGANPGRFDLINNGSRDADIRAAANRLLAAAKSGTTTRTVAIRPGHEMNEGRDFPWWTGFDTSATKVNYRNAFNRVASIFKDVLGDKVIVDWCVFKDFNRESNIEVYYPGDTNIDVCGYDGYDGGEVSTANNTPTATSDGPFTKFLKPYRAFAADHGKPYSVDEYGLRAIQNTGGCDNVFFVTNYYTYFTLHPPIWECWFRIDKTCPPAPQNSDVVHSLFYFDQGDLKLGTPFNGPSRFALGLPSSAANNVLGAYTGSRAGTTLASQKYLDLYGNG